jgi:hypothetical protein
MSDAGSFRERVRDNWGRMAYGAVVLGLAAGIFFSLLRQTTAASLMFAATCGLLITVPIVNVVMVLAEEIRRRDWAFVALALGVLGLIGWTVATKLL